jgi:hypothetical protein
MARINLTNLASYKAYFAAIATAHKEVDGYKYGDKDIIRNDNRSDMPPRVLWCAPYDRAKYGDKLSDNVHKKKVARVAYMKPSDSGSFADEDKVFQECEAVIEQILAKVYLDKKGANVANTEDPPVLEWTMIVTEVNEWVTGPIEMIIGGTKYYGCELEITFSDPTTLVYDASKWN